MIVSAACPIGRSSSRMEVVSLDGRPGTWSPHHGATRSTTRRRPGVRTVIIFVLLGIEAVIGLGFLVNAFELRDHAVRADATVVAVRYVQDPHFPYYEFTLRFTDRRGKQLTEQTDAVLQTPSRPGVGAHVEIYYASDDPATLTDVRYGPPGTHYFEMSVIFFALPLAAVVIAISRRIFRMIGDSRHRRAEKRVGLKFG